MLDVVLGCTLIFLLLSALVRSDGSADRETTLPEIDLTTAAAPAAGPDRVRRTTITIAAVDGEPRVWIDDTAVSLSGLADTLRSRGVPSHVALRRSRLAPCEWEDWIIIACREAGVNNIAIVVEQQSSKEG